MSYEPAREWPAVERAAILAFRPSLCWRHDDTVIRVGLSWLALSCDGKIALRLRGSDQLAWFCRVLEQALVVSDNPLDCGDVRLTNARLPNNGGQLTIRQGEDGDISLAKLEIGTQCHRFAVLDLIELQVYLCLLLQRPVCQALSNDGGSAGVFKKDRGAMLRFQPKGHALVIRAMSRQTALALQNGLLAAMACCDNEAPFSIKAGHEVITLTPGDACSWPTIRIGSEARTVSVCRHDMLRLAAQIGLALQ